MNTTIKTLAFLVVSSFMFMGGCLSKLTSVDFDYPTTATIMTNDEPTVGDHTYGETVITSTLKKELEDNNSSLDELDELKLKTATVSIDDSLGNFDMIDNIDLWLSADGQPEVMIATKNPVEKGSHSVKLVVNTNENLANYLKAATFTYRIKGHNNAAVPAMKLKVDATWIVKATAKK